MGSNCSPWFVLVLDDEPRVQLSVTRLLEKSGYNLLPARTVDEALLTVGPDVKAAILDVVLVTSGGLSGLDVLTATREGPDGPDVAVLMFSRNGSPRRTRRD